MHLTPHTVCQSCSAQATRRHGASCYMIPERVDMQLLLEHFFRQSHLQAPLGQFLACHLGQRSEARARYEIIEETHQALASHLFVNEAVGVLCEGRVAGSEPFSDSLRCPSLHVVLYHVSTFHVFQRLPATTAIMQCTVRHPKE